MGAFLEDLPEGEAQEAVVGQGILAAPVEGRQGKEGRQVDAAGDDANFISDYTCQRAHTARYWCIYMRITVRFKYKAICCLL